MEYRRFIRYPAFTGYIRKVKGRLENAAQDKKPRRTGKSYVPRRGEKYF